MLSSSWCFGAVPDELKNLRDACLLSGAPEDEKSLHLLIFEDGQPIACGSLFFDKGAYRIARLGVKPESRKQGVGDLAMRVLLSRAFGMMAERVVCAFPAEYTVFFTRYGFFENENHEWEVTPERLTLSSKCGHDCASCILKDSCH